MAAWDSSSKSGRTKQTIFLAPVISHFQSLAFLKLPIVGNYSRQHIV
jgi:hypothetical protein